MVDTIEALAEEAREEIANALYHRLVQRLPIVHMQPLEGRSPAHVHYSPKRGGWIATNIDGSSEAVKVPRSGTRMCLSLMHKGAAVPGESLHWRVQQVSIVRLSEAFLQVTSVYCGMLPDQMPARLKAGWPHLNWINDRFILYVTGQPHA